MRFDPCERARMLIALAVSEISGASMFEPTGVLFATPLGAMRGAESDSAASVEAPAVPAAPFFPPRIKRSRASAGKKSGIESSLIKLIRNFIFRGSYSTRTRVPAGWPARISLSRVSTSDAHRKPSRAFHAPSCAATYPGNLSVSSICNFTTLPTSSRKPTRILRTPSAYDCAHHLSNFSFSNFFTCLGSFITRVVLSSTYDAKSPSSLSKQSTSPHMRTFKVPNFVRTTEQKQSKQSTGSSNGFSAHTLSSNA
mmetsp:Transcript_593/g.2352  ORF Transcript_593/g.2352 Transcript_593/m.2352 type:complete len:254 (+) Transcript_593:327-1088(+)